MTTDNGPCDAYQDKTKQASELSSKWAAHSLMAITILVAAVVAALALGYPGAMRVTATTVSSEAEGSGGVGQATPPELVSGEDAVDAVGPGAVTGAPLQVASTDAGASLGPGAVWTLSDARVVEAGIETALEEGSFLSGRVIECVAQDRGDPAGVPCMFRIVLSAFRPAQDMPGQPAGVWDVRGSWSLSEEGDSGSRHAALLSGSLRAVTTNDLSSGGNLAADVTVPASIGADGYARGEGEFSGTTDFEGTLELQIR